MSFTYQDYIKSVGGVPGMTEQQFNEAFGAVKKEEMPLQVIPKRDARKASASLDNHIKMSESVKRKRVRKPAVEKTLKPQKEPKVKRANILAMTEEEKREHLKQKARRNYLYKKRKREEAAQNVPQDPLKLPYVFTKNMTPEEKKAHHAKLRRLRRLRKKRDGIPIDKKTPEQQAKQNEYNKGWHARKRNDPEYREKKRLCAQRYREKKRSAAQTNDSTTTKH